MRLDNLIARVIWTQVEEVVRRFPAVLVPVLVKAATGAAASDFLRTEAFRLMSDILTRYCSFSLHLQFCTFAIFWRRVGGVTVVLTLRRAAERLGVKNNWNFVSLACFHRAGLWLWRK